MNQQACPNCGYCPHCGRANTAPVAPYIPVYPQPFYPAGPLRWQLQTPPWWGQIQIDCAPSVMNEAIVCETSWLNGPAVNTVDFRGVQSGDVTNVPMGGHIPTDNTVYR